jgi:hypothetical protein
VAVSRALRRLLRIRDLEEEQARLALEAALVERHRLDQALHAASARERGGRELVAASARSGELPDRLAGLEETRIAERLESVLTPRLAEAEDEVFALRGEYLAARVERRQAGTLIEEAAARDALDFERRSQQGLDDWFRNRLHRTGPGAELKTAASSPHGAGSAGDPGRGDVSNGSERS